MCVTFDAEYVEGCMELFQQVRKLGGGGGTSYFDPGFKNKKVSQFGLKKIHKCVLQIFLCALAVHK